MNMHVVVLKLVIMRGRGMPMPARTQGGAHSISQHIVVANSAFSVQQPPGTRNCNAFRGGSNGKRSNEPTLDCGHADYFKLELAPGHGGKLVNLRIFPTKTGKMCRPRSADRRSALCQAVHQRCTAHNTCRNHAHAWGTTYRVAWCTKMTPTVLSTCLACTTTFNLRPNHYRPLRNQA